MVLAVQRRTCPSCGFEEAEQGQACPLCGATADALSAVERPTPTSEQPTAAYPPGYVPPGPVAGPVPLGAVFAGRYRLDAVLGQGGMGRVYRAHDLTATRDVALKVVRPDLAEDPQRVERFRREIEVLIRLSHVAIPRIFDSGIHDGQMYFASELISGQDLKSTIETRGPLAGGEVAETAAAVADALASAHENGVIHRDVKPNNVMIADDGCVKLVDFGLARGVGIEMATLTRTGMIVGTPAYMSPEQFEGRSLDGRTDIYSLGVVMYELLSGRLPFAGSTPFAVALQHKGQPPPSLRASRADVPAWLERACLRCLEKDPQARFASAAELSAELRREHSGVRRRRLPSGDYVVESDSSPWALELATRAARNDWTPGTALVFADRRYKLEEVVPSSPGVAVWTYRFSPWPEAEAARRLVDYESDSAARAAATPEPLADRVRSWWNRG